MQMKRELIEQFSLRKDYDQIICQPDISNKGLVQNLARLLFDDKNELECTEFDQICLNEIQSMKQQLIKITHLGILIRFKLENVL